MEALYGDWILQEGRELQEKYIEALQELADFHVAHRGYERGIEFYERILDKDNYRLGFNSLDLGLNRTHRLNGFFNRSQVDLR